MSILRSLSDLKTTLNLHEQPLTLEAGKPLQLCYGVAVWDGHAEAAQVQELYQAWIAGCASADPSASEGQRSAPTSP